VLVKKEVDTWLDEVDYSPEAEDKYVPSAFALNFINFIKLVNGETGEAHKSPVVHMKMLDQLAGNKVRLANLCSRGMAKTTLFAEYLVLYIAVFGGIEGFGMIDAMIYVSDSMENGVKSARKNIEFRYNNSEFLKHWVPKAHFTDNYMEFTNRDGGRLGVKMFGAKTGLRGTKIFGKRPCFAVLDDLVSDDDARSKVAMDAIKATVYKGVDYALDPVRRKIVFNGTPFNKNDILYEAVESGGWHVNVWPICEKFPCTKAEFRGAWEDRFSYEFVKEQYDLAVATGQVAAFMQELMLRITSEEERLVQDGDIRWYSRQHLLKNKHRFNFYITTDFATSEQQSADDSAISVWAYSAGGDWFWVDGLAKRQTMDKNINALFAFAQQYSPQGVGVEVTGQQGGFIKWIQQEMITRNIWFTLSSDLNGGRPGIRPNTSKLQRFNVVAPWFKAGKMYYPEEAKESIPVRKHMDQLKLVTMDGIKSKNDDCIDTISMLSSMNAWKPSEEALPQQSEGVFGADEEEEESVSGLASYTV
jgi:phage terminase large subunit-like protein